MADAFTLELVAGAKSFGDASHPSTQGALHILETLTSIRGMQSVLDMGCGSGILALTAAYQWHVPVLACDIEREAVASCTANAQHNKLDALVTALHSDGYSHRTIENSAPFDLILANLLADLHLEMAVDAVKHLADEGLIVLSGILRWRSEEIIESYRQLGMQLIQKATIGDWTTLLMQRQ